MAIQEMRDSLDLLLLQMEHHNFQKIEDILSSCLDMVSSTKTFAKKEEKVGQIKLLHDKALEYKEAHDEQSRKEEDPKKRAIRLCNLVELFKICELLKSVVVD